MADQATLFGACDADGADGPGSGAPIDGPGLAVTLHRGAFALDDADEHLAALRDEIDWRQDDIVVFGTRHRVPRLTAWFGDPGSAYTYSGLRMEPQPWSPRLLEIRMQMAGLAGATFDSVLANLYRDGRDSVGWHADDEVDLGREPVIASVSLGASRRFQLRRRDDPSERREVELHHGDVVIMRGPTQQLWLHQVPKTARPVGPRINLTFRHIVRPS